MRVKNEGLRASKCDAGWVLGGTPVTYREIEEGTGFNCRTLESWMQGLRREGSIKTEAVPTGPVIRITKVKKFPQFPPGASSFAGPPRKIADQFLRRIAGLTPAMWLIISLTQEGWVAHL